mmetsp:Transcript_4429/g.12563  ORF Transcript_4429/g.12563 Transcript_4429/m.12563 type:complete len:365 (-) Transcript_4429:84-1178(-)
MRPEINIRQQIFDADTNLCVCRQHVLCLLRLLAQLGHRPLVRPRLIALRRVAVKLGQHNIHKNGLQRITAGVMGDPSHVLHLELTHRLALVVLVRAELDQRRLCALRTQVVENHRLALISKVSLDPIMQRRGRMRVDQGQHVQACQLGHILDPLALCGRVIRWHDDHRVAYRRSICFLLGQSGSVLEQTRHGLLHREPDRTVRLERHCGAVLRLDKIERHIQTFQIPQQRRVVGFFTEHIPEAAVHFFRKPSRERRRVFPDQPLSLHHSDGRRRFSLTHLIQHDGNGGLGGLDNGDLERVVPQVDGHDRRKGPERRREQQPQQAACQHRRPWHLHRRDSRPQALHQGPHSEAEEVDRSANRASP